MALEFSLTYDVGREPVNTGMLTRRLKKAGCTGVTVVGKAEGLVKLEFSCTAATAELALSVATVEATEALPGARLVDAALHPRCRGEAATADETVALDNAVTLALTRMQRPAFARLARLLESGVPTDASFGKFRAK